MLYKQTTIIIQLNRLPNGNVRNFVLEELCVGKLMGSCRLKQLLGGGIAERAAKTRKLETEKQDVAVCACNANTGIGE